MTEPVLQTLADLADVPVVVCIRQPDLARARLAAGAALDGGLRAIEVTLTTPGALELIAELAADPRAIPGAGTVLCPADAHAVADAGGRFALSPVTDAAVVSAAAGRGLLAVPGAATPTEIHAAHRAGASLVKVFPIGPLGGVDFIRAVRGPLPQVPLLPTNGVRTEQLADYLAAGVVAVGMAGELFPAGALAAADPAPIASRARAIVEAVRIPIAWARRYFARSDTGDLDQILPCFAADAVYQSSQVGEHVGRDAIAAMMGAFYARHPGARWQVLATRSLGADGAELDFVMTAGATRRAGVERLWFDDEGLITRVEVDVAGE